MFKLAISNRRPVFDKKYWHGDVEKRDAVLKELVQESSGKIVLDFGPGDRPTLGTHTCGRGDVDLRVDFETMEFHHGQLKMYNLLMKPAAVGLSICSHVIEDLGWPEPLLHSLRWISEQVYIETPSALAELCPDVDAGTSIPWKGYRHHNWICWTTNDTLNLIRKHNMVEWYDAGGLIEAALRGQPERWIHQSLFSDFQWKIWRNEIDYQVMDPQTYFDILERAVVSCF